MTAIDPPDSHEMQHCDTLIPAGSCIPVEPRDLVLTEHAIAISDGRIVEVLPTPGTGKHYEPGVACAERVGGGTRLAIAEMLRSGYTCFSDQYFSPEIVAETAVDLDTRAMAATPVIESATRWAATYA